jgi:hypothetical protein
MRCHALYLITRSGARRIFRIRHASAPNSRRELLFDNIDRALPSVATWTAASVPQPQLLTYERPRDSCARTIVETGSLRLRELRSTWRGVRSNGVAYVPIPYSRAFASGAAFASMLESERDQTGGPDFDPPCQRHRRHATQS